jgi:molecular chaperone DnaJ
MPLDPYKTLGVEKTASEEEIRKAYKKLARTYHPDIDPSKDAAAKFQQVQQAYEILSDKQKRANFDQWGSADGPAFNPRTPPPRRRRTTRRRGRGISLRIRY